MTKCWQCENKVEIGGLFCPECKTIQLPSDIDYFTKLGLEKKFEIGEKILDVAYFSKQRLLHPDLFIKKSEQEKKLSMGHAVDLNDAYETLKSPLKRAEYILKLEGIIVNQDNSQSVKPSQELLLESLEMREELEGINDETELRTFAIKATDTKMACIDEIKKQLEEKELNGATQNTIRLRYLEKLIEEIKKK
jgi:molecular chaperone HscB